MQGVNCELASESYCRDHPHNCYKCANNLAPSRFRKLDAPAPKAERVIFQPAEQEQSDFGEVAYDVLTDNVEHYRRTHPIAVKPLMLILSVRKIPQVQEAFSKLDFIDKVWFRNFTPAQVPNAMNSWLEDHTTDHTHILLSSDDITPTPRNIRQLIDDVTQFNLPVISGYCNICEFDRHTEHGASCGKCLDNLPHPYVNVAFLPVTLRPIQRKSYHFLTSEWADRHSDIFRVWFQGNACALISKETWRKIRFRSWNKGIGGLMLDLAWAEDCAKENIPQFVDFRVNLRHYGTHHGRLLVGKEDARIDFEPSIR